MNVNEHNEYGRSYCGASTDSAVLVGRSSDREESILETGDLMMAHLDKTVLKFDLIVGRCESESQWAMTLPVRFEVSSDHGVTWRLFHRLRMRGQSRGGPQTASVYFATRRWNTYLYSLSEFAAVRCYDIFFFFLFIEIY